MPRNYENDESSDAELKEIRDQYKDDLEAWSDIRDEGDKDMRYRAGEVWSEKDRRAREDAGRPCISLDILGQHINKAINNVRQNKRDVQVSPVGDGVNDKSAERAASLIRGIDYQCKAQQADICAFENAVCRSYGFSELATVDDPESDTWDQNIVVKRIPNPNTVVIDPNYKMADASDMMRAFRLELLTKKAFKQKYPRAKVKSFTQQHARLAPGWIRDTMVMVAGYWKVKIKPRTQYLIQTPEGSMPLFEDELPGRNTKGLKIIKSRKVDEKSVIQQVVNGIEIIDERLWAGSYIPIIGCFGAELFLDDNGTEKRILLSLTRLARDAQMLHAYLSSQECEEAGMTPKAPFVGYKGQFESDAEAWEYLTKIPRAKVEVDVVVDGATGQVLPIPQRPQFQPNFAAYEEAKQSAERSCQSAMGVAPLPTAAQRQNQKSGVALERIDDMESVGSFHFTDNYDNYLENRGRQMLELMQKVIDTPRWMPAILKNGKRTQMRVNDEEWAQQNPDEPHHNTQEGKYTLTISTGPNYESERQEAGEFLDHIIENAGNFPFIPGPVMQKLVSLAIKLKPTLGAIGEEMADLLSPPDPNNLPPQAQAMITQAQGQVQQMQQQLAEAQKIIETKQIEHQGKVQIQQMKGQFDLIMQKLDALKTIAVAEITTKAQDAQVRQQIDSDVAMELHSSAHEVGMQAHQQAHEQNMQQAQAATQAQLADQGHQQALEQQAAQPPQTGQ